MPGFAIDERNPRKPGGSAQARWHVIRADRFTDDVNHVGGKRGPCVVKHLLNVKHELSLLGGQLLLPGSRHRLGQDSNPRTGDLPRRLAHTSFRRLRPKLARQASPSADCEDTIIWYRAPHHGRTRGWTTRMESSCAPLDLLSEGALPKDAAPGTAASSFRPHRCAICTRSIDSEKFE